MEGRQRKCPHQVEPKSSIKTSQAVCLAESSHAVYKSTLVQGFMAFASVELQTPLHSVERIKQSLSCQYAERACTESDHELYHEGVFVMLREIQLIVLKKLLQHFERAESYYGVWHLGCESCRVAFEHVGVAATAYTFSLHLRLTQTVEHI
jgi:hypothetical protein